VSAHAPTRSNGQTLPPILSSELIAQNAVIQVRPQQAMMAATVVAATVVAATMATTTMTAAMMAATMMAAAMMVAAMMAAAMMVAACHPNQAAGSPRQHLLFGAHQGQQCPDVTRFRHALQSSEPRHFAGSSLYQPAPDFAVDG
jgi:hypothetical protein